MKKIKLDYIIIPKVFLESKPSEMKIEKCRNKWKKYNKQPKLLIIDEDNVLIDGYIQYLVLKENNVEEAEVKISNMRKKCWYRKNMEDWEIPYYRNNTTTYVYGIHPNSKDTKTYVWRVPKSWSWFAENVRSGDSILCQTKFGSAPVIVTKVEVLDSCPVNIRIKRVASKEIRRGEYTVIP